MAKIQKQSNPLAIYIHLPFCIKKCNYCDFLSFPSMNEEKIESYIDSLKCQIIENKLGKEDIVKSIFIGGGTPSYISARYIEQILNTLRNEFNIANDAEITIEANPGTLNKSNISSYYNSGINRLSLGLQAIQPHLLKKLGRIHSLEDFKQSYLLAREVGFENINIDLMFALPDQGFEDWRETLKKVVELAPEHISAYSLIIEEGTPFYSQNLNLPSELLDREMYHFAVDYLSESGYIWYETSNFAKKNRLCRHNLVYWSGGNYLGFGLGAASLYRKKRFKCVDSFNEYLKHSYIDKSSIVFLTQRDLMNEFMFLGLRRVEGVSINEFYKRFQKDPLTLHKNAIKKHLGGGLLEMNGDYLRLTRKGHDLADTVCIDFIILDSDKKYDTQ